MPYSHTRDFPADILTRAASVRLACFDVDGTLTDGRLIFDSDGRELKAFHSRDGQGLALLRRAGIPIAFVTARAGVIAERRAAELGAEVWTKVGDKLACVTAIALRMGIGMQAVGLAVAPADAHAWVRERVHWRTVTGGGAGAARELCDLLLAAQGQEDVLLAQALQPEAIPKATLA